jgi:hypothetical protein
MTDRTMFDAIVVGDVPPEATMVAGYLDGSWPNVPQMRARFPHAVLVEVAVSVSTPPARGRVLDVESGDATAAEAVAWCRSYGGPNSELAVYCNASTWPSVRAAFAAAGVSEPNYWVAEYDNDPTIPAGAVAKQYASNDNFDTSSVSSYWPGVDPAPIPPEQDMPLTTADAQLVVKTLLNTPIWEEGDSPDTRTFGQLCEYLDEHNAGLDEAVAGVSTEVAAVATDVKALTAQLAALAAVVEKLAPAAK